MTAIPTSLEAAIAQSRAATRAAIENGVPPHDCGIRLSRTEGAAQWPSSSIRFCRTWAWSLRCTSPMRGLRPWRDGIGAIPNLWCGGIGELQGQMEPDDNAYIFVEPSSVEVVPGGGNVQRGRGQVHHHAQPQAGGCGHHRHRLRRAAIAGTVPQHPGDRLLPASHGWGDSVPLLSFPPGRCGRKPQKATILCWPNCPSAPLAKPLTEF